MSALEDFTLKLCRPQDNIFNDAVQLYEKTELPSIRRLNLEVEVYYGLLAPLRKRSLFSSLFFPGVVDLHVKCRGLLEPYNITATDPGQVFGSLFCR